MPKVIIRRGDGVSLEADVSFEELKELASLNGHKAIQTQHTQPELFSQSAEPRRRRQRRGRPQPRHGDFDAFYQHLSSRAKDFLNTVRKHPNGIEAAQLGPILGFTKATQIGGLTGPGIVKSAAAYGIRAEDLYRSVVTFPNGVRQRMFYPGRLLSEIEKPA